MRPKLWTPCARCVRPPDGPQILMLNFPRLPSAVRRLVVAGWIDAVERQFWRAGAHVRNERDEALAPSIADGHTARPVEAVVRRGLHVAARLHASPDGVFARVRQWKIVVLAVSACTVRLLVAAAALRVTAAKVLAHLHGFIPAVTPTQPVSAFRVPAFNTFNGDQLPETKPGHVDGYGRWHANDYKAAAPTITAETSGK